MRCLGTDAKAICDIALSRMGDQDQYVWHHCKNGLYTVKLGYRVAIDHLLFFAAVSD